MSEQEKKSGSHSGVAPAPVVVEQTTGSRHKQPHRPADRQEEAPDLHHKRSRAPAVPSVTEELKNVSEDRPVSDYVETKERKEIDNVISSDKYKKHDVAKKLTSSTKRGEPTGECITLATMEVDVRKGTLTPPPQPIPAAVKAPSTSDLKVPENESVGKKTEDTDNLTEEISELRTAETKYSEWSDDDGAGGLPRSASRASRVSRAVRQLLCCGVPYEAPSDTSLHRDHHSGI